MFTSTRNDPKNAVLEPDDHGNLAALIAFGLIAAVLVAHSIAGHVLYTDRGVPLFVFALPVLTLLGACPDKVSRPMIVAE